MAVRQSSEQVAHLPGMEAETAKAEIKVNPAATEAIHPRVPSKVETFNSPPILRRIC